MKIARRFLISGEVQGVGYRFFAQRAAARHQVQGYVRNLADGRVEALAEGIPESVEAFKHDLTTGPAYAAVQILADAISRAGSLDRDKIRDAIAATDMATVREMITATARRAGKHPHERALAARAGTYGCCHRTSRLPHAR